MIAEPYVNRSCEVGMSILFSIAFFAATLEDLNRQTLQRHRNETRLH